MALPVSAHARGGPRLLQKGVRRRRRLGFCALRRGWIDHLFVAHERHGRGVGQALLARALADRRRVKLWTFQRNLRSRAFYRMQGFEEVLFTDGAANEEKEPDVLLEWIRGRQKRE
jgi:putative acetyltransferase